MQRCSSWETRPSSAILGSNSSTRPEVHSGLITQRETIPNKNTWKHQRCKKPACHRRNQRHFTSSRNWKTTQYSSERSSIHPSMHPSSSVCHPPIHPSIFLPIQSINLSVCPSSIHPSIYRTLHYSSERSSMTSALCGLIINRG